MILFAISCAAHGPEGFPPYSLPHLDGPGIVGGGGIYLGDGAQFRFYNLATDADLNPARDEVRTTLSAHGWTIESDGASEVGTPWFSAASPGRDLCLKYIQVEAGEVTQATKDPVLSQLSISRWEDMFGTYHHLIFILSGPCQ